MSAGIPGAGSPAPASLPPRFLDWDACLNVRDFGGLPAQDGRRIRPGALVRSETTALLTSYGVQAALDYGIRTVIDLRFPQELDLTPSPFASLSPSVQYLNLPLDTDQDLLWPGPPTPAEAMRDLYCRLLETNHHWVTSTLRAMTLARPGGVLFNCHAGKDRTGVIAAVVLALLGAPDGEIAADYAVTYPRLEQRRLDLIAEPGRTPDDRAFLEVITSALPETMRLTLGYLRRQYGGVEGYLRAAGFTPEEQESLRDRLLE